MKAITVTSLCILITSIVGIYINAAVYTSKIEAEYPLSGNIIKVNDVDVHIIKLGTGGSPLLVVHGAGANSREFELSLAPGLSDNHRVLLADRPGHGYSERLKDAHRFNVQAAQMAGVLEELVPGEKAVIIGHSFGAPVSLRLALDRPELVRAVVLLAPVSHDWGSGKVEWFNEYASIPLIGHVFSQLMPIFGPGQARSGLWQTFDPAPEPENYYDDAGIGLLFRPANFRANAKDMSAFRDELIAQQDRYHELEVPIVIISGLADKFITPTYQNNALAQQVENLTIIPFADEGHVPHLRKVDEVVEAITRLSASN